MTTRLPAPCPSPARPPKTPQAATLGPSRSTPAARPAPPRRPPPTPTLHCPPDDHRSAIGGILQSLGLIDGHILCHRRIRMPQYLLNLIQSPATVDQKGRILMAKIMNPQMGNPAFFRRRPNTLEMVV